uniref:Uncharacterized protein n=1 Tax=Lotharella globosa TaxID=91324 RepID=A0A7S3Z843_9EUKA|mmetsp:Transcript_3116/g.6093  ORF Transcript_3116/g.6093 Transcript_3116/m.6093 type:complete len:525 (+) Transcript_3116:56-1630(+)
MSAIRRSSAQGDVSALLKALATSKSKDVNEPAFDGKTAFIIGAENGKKHVLYALMAYGSRKNTQDKKGLTALMHASRNGHHDVVQFLLQSKANPGLKDRNQWTALMHTCRNGNEKSVMALLDSKELLDVNAVAKKTGQTALHLATANAHENIVKALVEKGKASIRKVDRKKMTAMDLAMALKNDEISAYLSKVIVDKQATKPRARSGSICAVRTVESASPRAGLLMKMRRRSMRALVIESDSDDDKDNVSQTLPARHIVRRESKRGTRHARRRKDTSASVPPCENKAPLHQDDALPLTSMRTNRDLKPLPAVFPIKESKGLTQLTSLTTSNANMGKKLTSSGSEVAASTPKPPRLLSMKTERSLDGVHRDKKDDSLDYFDDLGNTASTATKHSLAGKSSSMRESTLGSGRLFGAAFEITNVTARTTGTDTALPFLEQTDSKNNVETKSGGENVLVVSRPNSSSVEDDLAKDLTVGESGIGDGDAGSELTEQGSGSHILTNSLKNLENTDRVKNMVARFERFSRK